LISDIGIFACSAIIICVFIPYMLVQLRNMPRWNRCVPVASIVQGTHAIFVVLLMICWCGCDHSPLFVWWSISHLPCIIEICSSGTHWAKGHSVLSCTSSVSVLMLSSGWNSVI
jgi:hypothetical protein